MSRRLTANCIKVDCPLFWSVGLRGLSPPVMQATGDTGGDKPRNPTVAAILQGARGEPGVIADDNR